MTSEANHRPANDTTSEPAPEVAFYPDGTALVRVEGMELHFTAAEGRPRIRDLDFAAWVGFKTTRNVRDLIRRMIRDGKLRDVHVVRAVQRTSMPGGKAERVREVGEFWLTREQALLVATQSNTPRAWALTELMVKVFDALLDRRTPPPPADATITAGVALALAQVPELIRTCSTLTAKVAHLETELASGVIGEVVAMVEIVRPLRRIAALYSASKDSRGPRKRFENRLRNLLGFGAKGSRWSMLPRQLLAVAQHQLALWLDESIAAQSSKAKAGQQGFAFVRGAA